ncbi:hypothetical protein F5B21DRAFT_497742 [Xylaria acuta]|nr:hypothetical protein F5B21DRAFT_497742 [Xylaria acuta]
MPEARLSDETREFSLERRPFEPCDRSFGCCPTANLPACERDNSTPIQPRFQLELRAAACVFLQPQYVTDRRRLRERRCCWAVPRQMDDIEVRNSDITRYLNSSPSCYGGVHTVFNQY